MDWIYCNICSTPPSQTDLLSYLRYVKFENSKGKENCRVCGAKYTANKLTQNVIFQNGIGLNFFKY